LAVVSGYSSMDNDTYLSHGLGFLDVRERDMAKKERERVCLYVWREGVKERERKRER
jgi:hypothetical protein